MTCLFCFNLNAQNKQIPVNEQLPIISLRDTINVRQLNELAYSYRNSKPDTTIIIANQSVLLCIKISETTSLKKWTGYSEAIGNLAIGYRLTGNFIKAKEFYFKALEMDRQLGYKFGVGKRLVGIANVFDNLGNYSKAMEYGFEALKANEEIKNKRAIALSYGVIGNIYFHQQDFLKAEKYQTKAIKLFEQIDDKNNVVATYIKIAEIQNKNGKTESALSTLNIALEKSVTHKLWQLTSETYNSIGQIYMGQKKYDKALYNLLKCADKNAELKINSGISNEYNNIGSIYLEQKKYSEAETYLLKSVKASNANGALNNKFEAEKNLAELYTRWNKLDKAISHYKISAQLKDSIFNAKNTQQIMNLEFNEKENQQKILQEKKDILTRSESKRQKTILLFGLVLIIILALFSISIYRNLQVNKKNSKTIAVQKQLVENKQKEILDSITYAKRLQEAILPPKEFITKNITDNFILYKPKDIVAGDFYWSEKIDNLFFIAAADCTGHGVPGAMVSVVCSNALNRTVKEFGLTDTGKILEKTRELVIETFEKSNTDVKDGMDISLLCIDKQNKRVFWSGANNPLWFVQDKQLSEIKADKQPIGKSYDIKPFNTNELVYKPDTTFYLFTDGLADQFGGPKGKKFKYKQFEELLVSINDKTMQQQSDIISEKFELWKDTLEQVDDVCIIGIKI